MNVFILSAYSDTNAILTSTYVKESAEIDLFGKYQLVEKVEHADLILFVENHPGEDPYFFNVLKHPIYKEYRDRCVLYHDNDHSLTFLPTISPSILKKHYNQNIHRSFNYITQFSSNPYLDNLNLSVEKKFLSSFIGASRTHPVRKELFKHKFNRSFLKDTSHQNSWELSSAEKEGYFKQYAEVSEQSKFILCPRGIGPSSYRLYESLRMGIAPVIISDEFVPPLGPDWNDFSIRVKEDNLNQIEHILQEREDEYERLGKAAREAWENFFSKDKQFHYLVEAGLSIKGELNTLSYISQYKRFITSSFHLRNLLRYVRSKIQK